MRDICSCIRSWSVWHFWQYAASLSIFTDMFSSSWSKWQIARCTITGLLPFIARIMGLGFTNQWRLPFTIQDQTTDLSVTWHRSHLWLARDSMYGRISRSHPEGYLSYLIGILKILKSGFSLRAINGN